MDEVFRDNNFVRVLVSQNTMDESKLTAWGEHVRYRCTDPDGAGVAPMRIIRSEKMVKHYCDVCGYEIAGQNCVQDRLHVLRRDDNIRVEVEMMVAINGTWNSGDICEACLRDIARHGENISKK
jgi:hypothetical protein